MNKVTVEFFHDVICSFCFPMSYRMRQLHKMMPEVEIVHRSYALVPSEQDFKLMFGSREGAKNEILGHWEHANQNDDLHRFNISGMRQAGFPFPTSTNGLLACKAAYFAAGNSGYWEVFDALQNALFVESRNIEEQAVIEDCIRKADISLEEWKAYFNSRKTKEAVAEDLSIAREYGIQSVPCLVINGKNRINGAYPLMQIIQAIKSAAGISESAESIGRSCRLQDGKMECD